MKHGSYYSYKKLKCRCDDCRTAYSERITQQPSHSPEARAERQARYQARRAAALAARAEVDDGIVDEIVVERLLAGIPTASTRRERLEAARVAYGREGWHDLCKRLGINSARARQITREVNA